MKISEIPNENLNTSEQILDIARRKSRAAVEDLGKGRLKTPFVILTADTEVILNGRAMGKPSSPQHAEQMLKDLSGRSHDVVTALVLYESQTKKEISHIETTRIKFRVLTASEIKQYVLSGEPMDKAGAYGIQGQAKKFVQQISGDLDNVIGLPTQALKSIILQNQWVFQ